MSAKAFYARIIDQVTALGGRVYPHEVPPTSAPTYPLAVYMGGGVQPVLGGESVVSESMQVCVIAATYGEARDISASIRAAINVQAGTWGGVTVLRAFYESGSEDVNRIAQSDLWIAEQTFTVWSKV